MIVLFAVPAPAFAQGCNSLKTNPPTSAIDYLQHTPEPVRTADCVQEAFQIISNLPQADAITLLISYLGYKRPLTTGEQNGFFMHGPLPDVLYPAVEDLTKIGTSAEPALLDFVAAQGNIETLESKNALYTLSLIHHGNLPALIKEINRRSATLAGTSMADNLHDAVATLLRQCLGDLKSKCEQAARQ